MADTMFKILPIALFVFCLSFASVQVAQAATLNVETIGGISVGTVVPTIWSHAGSNPIIAGSASPSATVQVSIDGTAYSTYADTLGDWSYTPTTLAANGGYEMVVTSGIENLIFTLNITGVGVGGGATSTTSATVATQPALPTALPSSGSSSAVFFILAGVILFGVGAVSYVTFPAYFDEEL